MTSIGDMEVRTLDDGTIVYTRCIELTDEERKLIESLTDEERDELLKRIKADMSRYMMREYDKRLYEWMMRGHIEL